MFEDFFKKKSFFLSIFKSNLIFFKNYNFFFILNDLVDLFKFKYFYRVFFRKKSNKISLFLSPIKEENQFFFTFNWLNRVKLSYLIIRDPFLVKKMVYDINTIFFYLA